MILTLVFANSTCTIVGKYEKNVGTKTKETKSLQASREDWDCRAIVYNWFDYILKS
jgi:hypothetical protein